MNEKIKEWLDGPQDYEAGLELYAIYGRSIDLLSRLKLKYNEQNRKMLVYELTRAAKVVPGKPQEERPFQKNVPVSEEKWISNQKYKRPGLKDLHLLTRIFKTK
jgi:hypothetical protein